MSMGWPYPGFDKRRVLPWPVAAPGSCGLVGLRSFTRPLRSAHASAPAFQECRDARRGRDYVARPAGVALTRKWRSLSWLDKTGGRDTAVLKGLALRRKDRET